MSEWLSIKTAPRDGTRVLLCRNKPLAGKPWHGYAPRAYEWDGEVWRLDFTFWRDDDDGPTHWMRLPDAPDKSGGYMTPDDVVTHYVSCPVFMGGFCDCVDRAIKEATP